MTVFLLDVNMLLALADPMHIQHESAHRWFAVNGSQGWSTCPLTENGFVRIASNPSYPNSPGGVATTITVFRRFCRHESHEFWPNSISLRNVLIEDAIPTHKHLTDLYLLALAKHNNGKLATLDRRIPAVAVLGGTDALEVVATVE